MNVFERQIEFEDRTRWEMFKAIGDSKMNRRNFIRKTGLSAADLNGILFDRPYYDVGSLGLRTIAEWFYFSLGKTPEISVELAPAGVEIPKPRSLVKRFAADHGAVQGS